MKRRSRRTSTTDWKIVPENPRKRQRKDDNEQNRAKKRRRKCLECVCNSRRGQIVTTSTPKPANPPADLDGNSSVVRDSSPHVNMSVSRIAPSGDEGGHLHLTPPTTDSSEEIIVPPTPSFERKRIVYVRTKKRGHAKVKTSSKGNPDNPDAGTRRTDTPIPIPSPDMHDSDTPNDPDIPNTDTHIPAPDIPNTDTPIPAPDIPNTDAPIPAPDIPNTDTPIPAPDIPITDAPMPHRVTFADDTPIPDPNTDATVTPITDPNTVAAVIPDSNTVAANTPIPDPNTVAAVTPTLSPNTVAVQTPIPDPNAVAVQTPIPDPNAVATVTPIPSPNTVAVPTPIPDPNTLVSTATSSSTKRSRMFPSVTLTPTLEIPVMEVKRLVMEVLAQVNPQLRIQFGAIMALHELCEEHITLWFSELNLCSQHADRSTVTESDILLRKNLIQGGKNPYSNGRNTEDDNDNSDTENDDDKY